MRVHIKCKQPAKQQQHQQRRREGDGGKARTRTTMTLALTQIYGNRRFVCDLECSHASVLVAYTCHIPNIKGMEGEKTKIRNKEMVWGTGGLSTEQGVQGVEQGLRGGGIHDGRGHAE